MTDFDLLTTCSFTGHRNLEDNLNIEKLEEVINKLINGGYKTFLVGMAIGFDLKVFEILQNIFKNIIFAKIFGRILQENGCHPPNLRLSTLSETVLCT